ncbi:hypothetical protein [Mesonia sp. HuA40]|uniref:hypothetical protein n=1 Tax=Mesonia sp. HuA40 TaxID=2602761 RepID=UPI0011C7833B|nr:hypothetical protein [Mesonia sp. HuA40]TXK74358.1 hypothetical protein FT993_02960 [Mesonia sp. HuA40]
MKTYLFPSVYQKLGFALFILALLLLTGVLLFDWELSFLTVKVWALWDIEFLADSQYFTFIENNIIDEIILLLFILGLLFSGFSKQKNEDEYIAKTRLSSLLSAVLINYVLLVLGSFFLYGLAFYYFVLFALLGVLLIYNLKFHLNIYVQQKVLQDEE